MSMERDRKAKKMAQAFFDGDIQFDTVEPGFVDEVLQLLRQADKKPKELII